MGVASIQDIEAMGMDVWPKGQGPTLVNKNIQERGLERLKVINNTDSGAGDPGSNPSSTALPNWVTEGKSFHVCLGSLA